jgi:nondiscriminating glutamyl-tRNA synthetase
MMGITHVIRGEDHLSNTAMQILLYSTLGFVPPVFAHHALILGRDRTKLSKRHGSVSVREFREQGILPEALMNYLALLAGSFGSEREVYNKESLIRNFSLERAGKSGAIFDQGKLRWLNAGYIRRESPENLTGRIEAFLNQENQRHLVDHNRMVQLVEAVQDNLITLCDAKDFLDIFLKEPDKIPEDFLPLIKDPAVQTILRTLHEILLYLDVAGDNLYTGAIGELERRSGRHRKNLLMPVRIALTGRAKGPELHKIFDLLEKNVLIRRLEKVIAL